MDERSERIQHRFEWPMLVAALLVIPVLVVEESGFGEPWATMAAVLNWGIWLAFLSEAVVMLWVVPRKRSWLARHPLDVVIVVFTPPFLPAALQSLRIRPTAIPCLGRRAATSRPSSSERLSGQTSGWMSSPSSRSARRSHRTACGAPTRACGRRAGMIPSTSRSSSGTPI
jgi:hypothetical protein